MMPAALLAAMQGVKIHETLSVHLSVLEEKLSPHLFLISDASGVGSINEKHIWQSLVEKKGKVYSNFQ